MIPNSILRVATIALLALVVACNRDKPTVNSGPVAGVATVATVESIKPAAKLSESVTIGDVKISVTKAGIGRIKLIGGDGKPHDSKEAFIWLKIRVENTSKTRILRDAFFGGDVLSKLEDEHGNSYQARDDQGDRPAESSEHTDIRPGESVVEFVVFERPVDAAKKFRLELKHPETGMESFYFEFSRAHLNSAKP